MRRLAGRGAVFYQINQYAGGEGADELLSAQTFLRGFSSTVWRPSQKEKQINTFSTLTGFELFTSLNKQLIACTKVVEHGLEHEPFALQRNAEALFRKSDSCRHVFIHKQHHNRFKRSCKPKPLI